MYKFESSQKNESRANWADSSKASSKHRAFNSNTRVLEQQKGILALLPPTRDYKQQKLQKRLERSMVRMAIQ